MLDWNQEFCVNLVTCFVHLLWQGLIIGAGFAVLMGVLRNRSPQSRHAWGLVCLLIFGLCVPVTYLTISDPVSSTSEVLTSTGQTKPAIQAPAKETIPLTTTEMQEGFNTSAAQELSSAEKTRFPVSTRFWDYRRIAPLLIAAYFVGVLFFVARLGFGVYLSRIYRQLATPVTQPELVASIEKVTRQIGLALQPPVMWCQQVGVPSVVGIFRPTVLLPLACLTRLKPEQLEQILFHELTHIRRYDHLFNLAQNTLEAVLFFHPVVWFISKRVRLEREFCCDAAVVAAGSHADEYAKLLIDVAEIAKAGSTRMNPIAVSATGRVSILGIRIERILGHRRSQKDRLFETGSLITTTMFLGLFCLLAFQVPSVADPIDDRATPLVLQEQGADTSEPKSAEADGQPKPAAPNEIVGIVIDEQGKPIEGVLVDAWTWWKGTETKTNKQGIFRLKPKSDGGRAEVRISKPGYSPHYIVQQACGEDLLTVTLNNKTYIEGQLLDPSGKPVANAMIQGLQGPKRGPGVMISEVKTETKTDVSGRYRMYVFPDTYEMRVSVPGVGVARVPNIVVASDQAKTLDLQLKQGVRFEARVIDADTGKPVEQVVLWSWRDLSVVGKSDANGKIVIDEMLPGEFRFQVGYGKSQKINGVNGYFHGILGRWWSPDAVKEWQHKTIQQDGWQRNFDALTFNLSTGMAPVSIVVEKGVEFSGKVFDPDGNPVAGATVAPAKSGSGNSLTGDTRYSVQTKEDGSYRVVMPAGNRFEYNLMVHDGKYQQWRNWANGVSQPVHSSPDQKFEDFNLTLTRPCTIKGRVVSASGRNVKGLRVGSQAADLLVNRYYDPTTKTKEDGTFELKFVRPGENYIRVDPFHFIATSGLPGTWEKLDLKSGEVYEDVELVIE